mgnify:CR=1 FL=1
MEQGEEFFGFTCGKPGVLQFVEGRNYYDSLVVKQAWEDLTKFEEEVLFC